MIPFMHEHIGPADKVCPRCEIDRERRPSRQPRGAPEPSSSMTERPPTTHERANTELAQLLADPDFALKAATLFPLSVRLTAISQWTVFCDDDIKGRNKAAIRQLSEVANAYVRRMNAQRKESK